MFSNVFVVPPLKTRFHCFPPATLPPQQAFGRLTRIAILAFATRSIATCSARFYHCNNTIIQDALAITAARSSDVPTAPLAPDATSSNGQRAVPPRHVGAYHAAVPVSATATHGPHLQQQVHITLALLPTLCSATESLFSSQSRPSTRQQRWRRLV